MSLIGNIIWFLFGGFVGGVAWALVGVLWCLSIIGIPVGIQCFKFAKLSFFPFGKDIVYGSKPSSLLLNILWLIFGGLELAFAHVISGIVLAATIIGIPLAIQSFKLAKLSLMPFGARVVGRV